MLLYSYKEKKIYVKYGKQQVYLLKFNLLILSCNSINYNL